MPKKANALINMQLSNRSDTRHCRLQLTILSAMKPKYNNKLHNVVCNATNCIKLNYNINLDRTLYLHLEHHVEQSTPG